MAVVGREAEDPESRDGTLYNCFWLTGFPFVGATRRLRRGVVAFNDAHNVRAQVAQPA
jgi:hypothetical protein